MTEREIPDRGKGGFKESSSKVREEGLKKKSL